jgi:leucyl aminopeptidase
VELRFQSGGPSAWKADAALLFVCRGDDPAANEDAARAAPWFAIAPGLRDFRGEKEECLVLYGHPDLPLPRVIITGLGPREDFSLDGFRRAVASAVRRCRDLGIQSLLIPAPGLESLPGEGGPRLIEEAVFAACIGLYNAKKWRTRKEGEKNDPEWLALAFAGDFVPDVPHGAARRGEYAAGGVALARDLVNTPSNLLTPAALALKAEELAARHGLNCEVLDKAGIEAEGMGGLAAVGAGSVNEPRLVLLEYRPKECAKQKPLVLVAKGLCFDSGGISLKPAANMHHMKGDMAGAAAVLGALEAIALERIPRRVAAVLACAENIPDGRSVRPGDVVTTLSGLNVEILNTDAEGRMALCDALTYARRRFAPEVLVDIATLTGACAVALGNEMAGLFCADSMLAEQLKVAGGVVGDHLWPLPLWDNYRELLKSEVADCANIGPREGGAINAAIFLKQFVEKDLRWAHIDMAGTERVEKGTPLCPAGGSGYGVRLLTELARAAA